MTNGWQVLGKKIKLQRSLLKT
jgi:hypothetical protein